MLLSSLLVFLALSLSALGFRSGLGLHQRALTPQEAVLSDNLTDQVQWDEFSLIVRGQRVFLYSGEFHTFRLPVPSLWLDILQKVKAAGLNAVSVYTHWALLNPSPGVVDFNDFRDLQPLFDAAKEAGVFIVLRPGPYINAETTAGGIAHWVTSQVAGALRTNASDFEASWQDYISGIINATKPNQITEGGPVIAIQIDNEYNQRSSGAAEYFVELEAKYRENGIVIPLTYNDPGEGKNFVNGTGAVDIYGLDSYPQGFDCSNPERWAPVVTNYHDYHEDTSPSEPFYFPEFQGGSFDAWGPNAPGYPNCQVLTGADFEDVFYKTLWAANAKLINFYMVFGGTSWGGLPFPGVYTSYDYGSSIMENRFLSPKWSELKKQGLFLRSSPEFRKTNWIGNSSTGAVNVSNPDAFVVLLTNPDTGANFYIARQTDSTSTATTEFSLEVSSQSLGTVTVPQTNGSLVLNGRQSKVIVTDFSFGKSSILFHSTASIFFAGTIGKRDVLFLFGDSDQSHEFSFAPQNGASIARNTLLTTSRSGNSTLIGVLPGVKGLITVVDSDTQLVLFADSLTADTFFAPVIPSSSGSDELANFWQFGSNSTVLVGGPHLVRNATVSRDGATLALRGDLNTTSPTLLTVIAPSTVRKVTWNGNTVESQAHTANTASGIFVGTIQAASSLNRVTLPELKSWKFKDSLPEIQGTFSDAEWIVANHTTTNIPDKPLFGDGRVLYSCDYGFCENIVLWRGHFNGTGNEASVNLTLNGGEAFAASVWLNDVFLDTSFGNSSNNANSIDETNEVFTFPDGAVNVGKDNVITVVLDNMGLDESGSSTNAPKSARGIRGFQLNSGNFSEWKVQGKIGGYTNFPDKVRGVLNEGGLFGEREGWHLPGFDTSSWPTRNITDGLPNDSAGVGFFVTTFKLDIPSSLDAAISFLFDSGSTETVQPYRALLFVNGWMMGKRVGNLGPQTKFPVHPGILDFSGENTVAVALWNMLPNATISPTLELSLDGIVEGGVGGVVTNNPGFRDRSNVKNALL